MTIKHAAIARCWLFALRERLTQALDIYKQSAIYSNEAARTYYKLGQVYSALDMTEKAEEASRRAEELRKELMKEKWAPATSEDDFDNLIVAWSR